MLTQHQINDILIFKKVINIYVKIIATDGRKKTN